VLLLNGGGYLLIFQYLIYRADVNAEKKIDIDNYKKGDLSVIKIPVRMPAVEDEADFEQTQGHIQYQGYNYNFVGLKVARDTMFLLCLPNKEKNHLVDERNALDKEINDSGMSKKTQNLLKITFKPAQYCSELPQFLFSNNAINAERADTAFYFSIENPFIDTRGRPPEDIA
jgi:hypothetical protein